MEKNLKIEKLSDIVAWADGLIKDGGYNEEKYRDDASTAYCCVKAYELWKIRDTVLKGMERHAVYTNSLSNDIADKAAKIDLLEKEIEGRKEGYYALKTQMDSSLAKKDEEIEELNKEVEKRCKDIVSQAKTICVLEKENATRRDLAKMNKDTIVNQYEVCEEFKNKITELEKELAGRKKTIELLDEKVERQRENLNALNKTLEIKTKENERLIAVRNNQDKEIDGHEAENARLSEKIIELKKERDRHMARVNDLRMELDCVKASKEKYEEATRDKTIEDLRESFNYWRTKCLATQEENEKLKVDLVHEREKNEKLAKDHAELENEIKKCYTREKTLNSIIKGYWDELKNKEDDHGRAGFKRYIEYLVKEEGRAVPERFKERLNEEITEIFEKEEETEVKGVHRMSSGRYPWGAEVNDIPCGEDAIE